MKKIKTSTKKTKLTAIFALILLMTSTFMLLSNILVQAQEYTNMYDGNSMPLPAGVTPDEEFNTIPHLSFRPNPIGVNQPLLVNIWMQPPISVNHYFKDAFMVTFTKPDGTTIPFGPMTSYQGDASAWFEYSVDQVGTWKIKFDFLGAYFPAGNYTIAGGTFSTQHGEDTVINFPLSVYYKPSSDGPYDFVVQEDMVLSWPPSELPTDYWTRPVSPENREWWAILGNYPSTGVVGGGPNWPAETNKYMSNYDFVPYVQAPNTAHIVWKRQDAISGLIGGSLGQISLSRGGNTPSIIYAGRCYDSVTKIVDGQETNVFQCYDLRTGEVYWEKTGVTRVPSMLSYTERTVEAVPGETASKSGLSVDLLYVGGGRLIKYDPWIGSITTDMSIAPLSSAILYNDPYFLSVQNLGGGQYRLINWTIVGYLAHHSGYEEPLTVGVLNNVSYPFSSIGVTDYESMIAIRTESISSVGAGGEYTPAASMGGVSYSQRIIATSLLTGNILWNITTDQSTGLGGFFSGSTSVADHGKFAVRLNDGHWHCWDLHTGNEAWVGELSSWPWGTFGCYGVQSYGGNIISNQYDGVVAYDWDDGTISWHYKAPSQYQYETPYYDEDHIGQQPWFTGTSRIADGKLYAYNTEHTPSNPITRGWAIHCINATTGEGIWNITGSMAPGAVADGYLTAGNSYDGYMYVFGKGESATTVTAPDVSVSKGTAFTIKGSVLDQSPAQPGTPCVSKESMTTQMEYLHMQRPIDGLKGDAIITGVPVTLTAIGEDGTYVDIGTTITDGYSGKFGYAWTPTIEGTYKIIASFEGDESYGSSSDATFVTVGPAAAAGPQGEPGPTGATGATGATGPAGPQGEPGPAATEGAVSTEIGIIIAIVIAVIISIAGSWFILKRK